jgi:hypothetical protein
MTDKPIGTADVPAYHVLGDQIRQEDTLAPGNGGLTEVYVIPYMIDEGPAKGHTGSVKLDPSDYDPEHVREAIEGQVANTHNIAALGKRRV